MKSTETRYRRALEILDQLAAALDAERLSRQIDEPVDRALREFECPQTRHMSNHQFLDVLARFLRHLHARAFPNGRQLSIPMARDEAVALLSHATSSADYYDAFFEATELGDEGLANVLVRVADLVTARQRDAHVRWAVSSHIEPGDWRMKCQMAAILLERCRPWLPTEVRNCPPEQMADHVLELLAIDLATRDQRSQTANSSGNRTD